MATKPKPAPVIALQSPSGNGRYCTVLGTFQGASALWIVLDLSTNPAIRMPRGYPMDLLVTVNRAEDIMSALSTLETPAPSVAHIEPDGADASYAVESRYGVGQGEDWFPVYLSQSSQASRTPRDFDVPMARILDDLSVYAPGEAPPSLKDGTFDPQDTDEPELIKPEADDVLIGDVISERDHLRSEVARLQRELADAEQRLQKASIAGHLLFEMPSVTMPTLGGTVSTGTVKIIFQPKPLPKRQSAREQSAEAGQPKRMIVSSAPIFGDFSSPVMDEGESKIIAIPTTGADFISALNSGRYTREELSEMGDKAALSPLFAVLGGLVGGSAS